MLLSATLPRDYKSISLTGARDPVFVRVEIDKSKPVESIAAPSNLKHCFLTLHETQKLAFLMRFIKQVIGRKKTSHKILIFVPTTKVLLYLSRLLTLIIIEWGLLDDPGKKKFSEKLVLCRIAGKMDGKTRKGQLARFMEAEYGVLLATDVASRGIDFDLEWVISYALPNRTNSMIHRGGRTARAGNSGTHLVLVSPHESDLFSALFKQLGIVFSDFSDDKLYIKMTAQQLKAPLRIDKKAGLAGHLDSALLAELKRNVYVSPGEQNIRKEMKRYSEMAENKDLDSELMDQQAIETEHQRWLLEVNRILPEYMEDSYGNIAFQRALNTKWREYFLMSEEAAISYIASYEAHEKKNTFRVDMVPMGILCNSFGLLKLPRLKEIKGKLVLDFEQYRPPSGDYLDIKYFDESRQEAYESKLTEYRTEIEKTREKNLKKKRKHDELNSKLDMGYLLPNKKRELRRQKKVTNEQDDMEQLKEMKALMRQEKKKKISKEDVNKLLDRKSSKNESIRI